MEPTTKISPAIDRRKFFKLFGGGLAVVFVFEDITALAESTASNGIDFMPDNQVAAWIHITEDSIVNVYTGKVEVGQNIRTSLSQLVAEELNIAMSSVKMIMADTDLVPFDFGTFGSLSIPQMGTELRKAAATARQALTEMAAKRWSVNAASLQAKAGMILDPQSGKKISYVELTKGAQILLPIAKEVDFIKAEDWQLAGRTIPKVNGASFITGAHKYVSDMKLPEMLYAKVLRAPSYNAKLIEVNADAARAMPGVIVVQQDNFIAVAAPSLPTAVKALSSVKVKWEESRQPSRAELFDHLLKTASKPDSPTAGIQEGLTAADIKHSATYKVDYIAHVPLEPRAALAQWVDGKLTVWTGTQRPFAAQQSLAEEFGIPKEKVRVIVPDTGSGYGGKHSAEAGHEAARLAKATKRPVKLVWTRKEEFTWAYVRPAGVIEVSSGVKKDGTITAWVFNNYNSGGAGLDTLYKILNKQIAHYPSKTPLKQGSYRGLASTANVFARESHISDLAKMTGIDQLEFRLKNLDDQRLMDVLTSAAKSFGWATAVKPAGHGFGIACSYEKGGYVATCVEIAVQKDNKVKIIRITEAFECGAIINPHHLEHQISGAIVQGLGGALFEAIDFADGKIINPSLSTYRVPRFGDVPKIEIIMLDRKDLPSSGAGEAPIVGVAPAIRNAILDATGIALRNLPLLPDGMIHEDNSSK